MLPTVVLGEVGQTMSANVRGSGAGATSRG